MFKKQQDFGMVRLQGPEQTAPLLPSNWAQAQGVPVDYTRLFASKELYGHHAMIPYQVVLCSQDMFAL